MGNKHQQTTDTNTQNQHSYFNHQHSQSQSNKIQSISQQQTDNIHTSWHTSKYPYQLANIFNIFTRQPLYYVNQISVISQNKYCCGSNVVKLETFLYNQITLDNLLVIKRMKKVKFAQAEIWHIIQQLSGIFMYMQSYNIPYGSISAKRIYLKQGKFIKIGVCHIRLDHQHCNLISLSNYYSPEFVNCLKQDSQSMKNPRKKPHERVNIFKSEVFAFGLLLLEILVCPEPHPKFMKYNFEQFLWGRVYSKLKLASQYYSMKLINLISMMLRQDWNIRPDWSYLRVWVKFEKQAGRISVAPCVYWSI